MNALNEVFKKMLDHSLSIAPLFEHEGMIAITVGVKNSGNDIPIEFGPLEWTAEDLLDAINICIDEIGARDD